MATGQKIWARCAGGEKTLKKGFVQHQPSCSSVSIWFIVGLACVAGLALLSLLATIILLSRRSSSSRRRNPDPAVFLDQLPPGRRQEDKEPSGVEELSRRAQERSSWMKQQDFPRYPVSRHLYQVDGRYIVVFLEWNHKTWSLSRPRKDKRGSDNKDLVEDRHWTTWTSDFTNCRASLAFKYIPIVFGGILHFRIVNISNVFFCTTSRCLKWLSQTLLGSGPDFSLRRNFEAKTSSLGNRLSCEERKILNSWRIW